MTGGWTCKHCADYLGLPFDGIASSYGYCKAGDHHVQQIIRWAKDLDVDRAPPRVQQVTPTAPPPPLSDDRQGSLF